MLKHLTIAALPFLALSAPAHAAFCLPVNDMLEKYEAEFGETPVWGGVSAETEGNGVIILSGPYGTWTMLFTDGATACMADFGNDATAFPRANV